MALFDSFKLTGKVAVVTGGRTGIGNSLSRALAEAEAHVVVAARDIDGCRAAAAEITASGGRAIAVPLDVTDRRHIEALVREVNAQLGPIDILVNNAVCVTIAMRSTYRTRSGTASLT
jgi:NAD(P)-dependent dehydrogenase (short-subunit alcohol dehydrogenase family)